MVTNTGVDRVVSGVSVTVLVVVGVGVSTLACAIPSLELISLDGGDIGKAIADGEVSGNETGTRISDVADGVDTSECPRVEGAEAASITVVETGGVVCAGGGSMIEIDTTGGESDVFGSETGRETVGLMEGTALDEGGLICVGVDGTTIAVDVVEAGTGIEAGGAGLGISLEGLAEVWRVLGKTELEETREVELTP